MNISGHLAALLFLMAGVTAMIAAFQNTASMIAVLCYLIIAAANFGAFMYLSRTDRERKK